MRGHQPDPGALVEGLARRLDGVDLRLAVLDQVTADVSVLGRGLGELAAQVRALTDATNRTILSAPNRPTGARSGPAGGDSEDGDGDGNEQEGEGEGQPDWLTVTDSATAGAWLADAMTFAGQVLAWFPGTSLPGCWPLHPAAVVEVVALRRQYESAYTGTDPGPVSEFLGRWLPGAVRRLKTVTASCENRMGHLDGTRAYQVPHLDPARVALWWIDSRATGLTAAEAFALSPLAGER